jgi:hypothetical protein
MQELHGDDCDRRQQFSEWITQEEVVQPSIYSDILFSDEAIFHLNGMVNCHYYRYWANGNPHWAEQIHVQSDPKVVF